MCLQQNQKGIKKTANLCFSDRKKHILPPLFWFRICRSLKGCINYVNRSLLLHPLSRYILSCHQDGYKLDYRSCYLLPAGWSSLLMQEVNQGGDYRSELRVNGCLLPSPVATRLSSKAGGGSHCKYRTFFSASFYPLTTVSDTC